jgi:hypothetical protein
VNFRDAVKGPPIVEQDSIARILQGKAPQLLAFGRPDLSDTIAYILASNEHDEDPVDAIAVQSLRRRATDVVRLGLDPELMEFYMPGAIQSCSVCS